MLSTFPRIPDSTGWCESWGASPSSNTCACCSVVDDFFEAVLDFFFLLYFAVFDDDELEDLVEESEEGAPASVCASAPAVKQSAAAEANKSLRSCISPSRKFISKLLLFRGPSIKVN